MKLHSGFQRMMRSWERWHPVNAVQFMELERRIEITHLRPAVENSLRKLEEKFQGGAWRLGFGQHNTDFRSVVEVDIPVLESDQDLEQLITSQMNRPFKDAELPLRIGMARRGMAYICWLSYRHVIADARSIAILFQHILEEVATASTEGPEFLLKADPIDLEAVPEKVIAQTGFTRKVRNGIKELYLLQRCSRKRRQEYGNYQMSFRLHGASLPLDVLKERSGMRHVSVGELLTATVLEWLRQLDKGCNSRTRKSGKCVSVIADLVSRLPSYSDMNFGQYICPFNIFDFGDADFETRLETVHRQLRRNDSLIDGVLNLSGLGVNSFLLQFLPGRIAEIDQEFLFPIGGAVSNVNLNRMLPTSRLPSPVKTYWRSTCATQFSPVIVCLTTHGQFCTLTTTHLNAVYTNSEIARLGQLLRAWLFGVNEDRNDDVTDRGRADDGMAVGIKESGFNVSVPQTVY